MSDQTFTAPDSQTSIHYCEYCGTFHDYSAEKCRDMTRPNIPPITTLTFEATPVLNQILAVLQNIELMLRMRK
jgi:hypothetical protein